MTLTELAEQKSTLAVIEAKQFTEMFACGSCENIYSDEYRADECCPTRTVIICNVCGKDDSWHYSDEKEVKAHIAKDHPSVETTDEENQRLYDEALRNGYIGGQTLFEFENQYEPA